MNKTFTLDDKEKIIRKILNGKTSEDRVEILENCLYNHVFEHGWIDDELLDSILGNIAREYKIPYKTGDY